MAPCPGVARRPGAVPRSEVALYPGPGPPVTASGRAGPAQPRRAPGAPARGPAGEAPAGSAASAAGPSRRRPWPVPGPGSAQRGREHPAGTLEPRRCRPAHPPPAQHGAGCASARGSIHSPARSTHVRSAGSGRTGALAPGPPAVTSRSGGGRTVACRTAPTWSKNSSGGRSHASSGSSDGSPGSRSAGRRDRWSLAASGPPTTGDLADGEWVHDTGRHPVVERNSAATRRPRPAPTGPPCPTPPPRAGAHDAPPGTAHRTRAARARMVTGGPSGSPTSSSSAVMTSSGSRMQPELTSVPTSSGRFVPWMPMTPSPPAKSVRTSDNSRAVAPLKSRRRSTAAGRARSPRRPAA